MLEERSHALDLSKLNGPPLQRTLQLVCETGSPRDACSLLRTCRWIRSAAQHSCAGLVPVECSSTPQQALAVAAWLKHNPSLARSLSINFPDRCVGPPKSDSWQAAVPALAQALQTCTSICLISSCCLLSAGPECVELLQQLPSRHLTSIRMSLLQPYNVAFADDQLQQMAAALSQLQQLESVELGFSAFAVDNIDGLDCLLTSMSEMSKLTSLKLQGVSSNAELQHLPTHLKEFQFSLHTCTHEMEVQLDHLTQLTKLIMTDNSSLCSGSTLPASLQQLAIGEFESTAALTQLSQLKDLSLTFYAVENAGTEALAQLSSLRALTSVDLCFETGAVNGMYSSSVKETTCLWEHLPVRKLWIDPYRGNWQPPSDLIQHMTSLKQLTQLGLTDVDFVETTFEQFAVVLRQLTALQRLRLMHVKYRASDSTQIANIGDSVSDSTIRDAATSLGPAQGQCEHADAVDLDTVIATMDFEHVAEAIASLPDLCALSLVQQPITPRAAQHLRFCCGNVQELCLVGCCMTDATLGCILEGLCEVAELDVTGNRHLTDRVLLLMQDHLQCVGKCCFARTQITRAGVKRYLADCDAVVDQ